MNSRQREVLQQHRNFLARNVVWTEEFGGRLVAQGLIPESLYKDIQNGEVPSRKEKITKILDILPLRGAVYDKFCDLLQLSGHVFLAEFLRDEETAPETVDIRDMYKRLPFLERTIKELDRKQIETYIIEKTKEAVLRSVWGKDTREKDKAIEAKQELLEQAFEFEDKTKQKNAEIAKLEQQLTDVRNESIVLQSQIRYMTDQFKDTEDKLKTNFGVQMKFSMANENVINKLNDKLAKCETVLKHFDNTMKEVLVIPTRNSERDHMALTDFPFAFVTEDFDKLISKYTLLISIEKQYETLLHERHYILAHLGFHQNDDTMPSLLNAYREFAVRTDEDMMALREQVAQYNETIEGQKERLSRLHKETESKNKLKNAGSVWQNAIMSVMRRQLNDIKHECRLKDTKLKHFETEILKLKAKIVELESGKWNEKHPHTHSVHRHVHKSHRDASESAVNGRTSVLSSVFDDDDESVITKADATRRRNNLLPPLGGGRVLYPSVDGSSPAQQSSRRQKASKPAASSGRSPVSNVEGLLTASVKLENRGHGANKGHVMSHGLGDLKAMHTKHGKYVTTGMKDTKGHW